MTTSSRFFSAHSFPFFLSLLLFFGVLTFLVEHSSVSASFAMGNITHSSHFSIKKDEKSIPFSVSKTENGIQLEWKAEENSQNSFWFYEVRKDGKNIFRSRDLSIHSFVDTEEKTGEYTVLKVLRS